MIWTVDDRVPQRCGRCGGIIPAGTPFARVCVTTVIRPTGAAGLVRCEAHAGEPVDQAAIAALRKSQAAQAALADAQHHDLADARSIERARLTSTTARRHRSHDGRALAAGDRD